MRDGVCPKCGSADVRFSDNVTKPSSIFPLGQIQGLANQWLAIQDHYVCVQCGYVESYISDTVQLVEIAHKWRKVNKRQ